MGISTTGASPCNFKLPDESDFQIFLPHETVPTMVADDLQSWCLPAESVSGEGTGLGALLVEWSKHPDVNLPPEADLSEIPVLGFHSDGVQYTSTMRAGGAQSVLVGSLNIISSVHPGKRKLRISVLDAEG